MVVLRHLYASRDGGRYAMNCIRCGKFMKKLRSQLWACRCGQVRACISGPDSTQAMQDFVNICYPSKRKRR